MTTLNLIEIQTKDATFFGIEEVDDDGHLVDVFELGGERTSCRDDWEVLVPEVGNREYSDDTDSFWYAVNAGICWLAENRSREVSREAFCSAYAGILSESEINERFEELLEA